MASNSRGAVKNPGFSKQPGFSRVGETGFLLSLILLGFALRVLRLQFQPLWWDEGYSVWFATHPLGQMLALTAQDIHPPLYYALLRGWILSLGPGPVALRLFSTVIGVLAVPLIYLAGRRMFTRRAAWLATLLLAINPLHIFYSQEVRMYGLVALLSIGILLAAWRVFDGSLKRSRLIPPLDLLPYILLTTAALYTQYYAVFLPIGLTLYAIWWWGRRSEVTPPVAFRNRILAYWMGAQAVVALLYLPWLLYAGPKLVPYVSQKVVQDADRPLGLLVYLGRHLSAFLAGHLEGPLARFWPMALVLLVPLGFGFLLLWILDPGSRIDAAPAVRGRQSVEQRSPDGDPWAVCHRQDRLRLQRAVGRQPSAAFMLAAVLITALLLGWLLGLRYPFFPERGERLLLLALPTFILLAAAGLDALIGRVRIAGYVTLGLIIAVSAASLAGFYTVPRYPDDDYRPLIARIVEQGLPGDTYFAVYPWQAGYWRSYGNPAGPSAVLTPDPKWAPAVLDALDAALIRGRVWFPGHMASGALLESRIEDYLASKSVPFLNEWHGPNTRLSAWAASPYGDSIDFVPMRFPLPNVGAGSPPPGAVELTGITASVDPVPAANAVTALSLRWRADVPPPVLDVSVRLTDDLGQIWAQHDYEPLGGLGLASAESSRSCPSCTDQSEGSESRLGVWEREDRLGLLVPAGTPPGRYHVQVLVRPKEEERPLEVVAGSSTTAADGTASARTAARLFDMSVLPSDRALDPERLPIASRQEVDLADSLRFLGYSASDAPAVPGELRKFNLFWEATGSPAADYVAFVQLLDRQGRVAAGWEAPPGAGYPTSSWAPGALMRTQATLRVPANLPGGRYRLIAGLFRSGDKARLPTARGDDHLALGSMTVRSRPHHTTPPLPGHQTDVRFDDVARLVGYDLAMPQEGIQPGNSLPLTLHWQALGTADRPYTVFVHLLDDTGVIRGYGDGEPGGGAYPTTGWLPGEYIADQHEVIASPDAPAGTYRLAVGLYDPATGQRLAIPTMGTDRMLLDVPVVVRAEGAR